MASRFLELQVECAFETSYKMSSVLSSSSLMSLFPRFQVDWMFFPTKKPVHRG